jgi:hypothetical protein
MARALPPDPVNIAAMMTASPTLPRCVVPRRFPGHAIRSPPGPPTSNPYPTDVAFF